MPLRYSRHYADVAQMSQKQVVDEALSDMDLLNSVITHKDRFYHCGWAKYDLAMSGSFHLVPPQGRLAAIRRDYRNMTAMFFSAPPTFDDILKQLYVLENQINLA